MGLTFFSVTETRATLGITTELLNTKSQGAGPPGHDPCGLLLEPHYCRSRRRRRQVKSRFQRGKGPATRAQEGEGKECRCRTNCSPPCSVIPGDATVIREERVGTGSCGGNPGSRGFDFLERIRERR